MAARFPAEGSEVTFLESAEGPEAAEIAKALTEDIIFGRLEPGARLIEDNLIARFRATRHYIRQALNELERTGIATREKNKGVTVRSPTSREVQQIYEVRELLQRHAALRIPLPVPPNLIERLQHLHSEYGRHLRSGNFSAVHEINDAFHIAMFSACNNQHLVNSIKHYMWLTLAVRAKKTVDIDHALTSERDHHVMIQMLRGTDNWALAQLCVDHLQGPKNSYLEAIERGVPRSVAAGGL
jgi:DNA-binding GntR family transcriptional regulator